MSMTGIKAAIADTIKRGITHYGKIAVELNKTEGNIRKTLSIMKNAGQIIPIGNGNYKLPEVQVDNTIAKKNGVAKKNESEPKPDYIKSNELALNLLVKTREIVNNLINEYNEGKTPFPKEEIYALKILETAYKEELRRKTEIEENKDKNQKKPFIILPHNNRSNLTEEQYEDHCKYERTKLGLESELPTENVIIEDNEEQLRFPF